MVSLAVEMADAAAGLGKLIQEVGAGAEVVITRDGRPVARLIPAEVVGTAERIPGTAKGLFTVPDDFDSPVEDFRDYV